MTNTEKLGIEGALLILHRENCFIAEAIMGANQIDKNLSDKLIKSWDERINAFLGGCE